MLLDKEWYKAPGKATVWGILGVRTGVNRRASHNCDPVLPYGNEDPGLQVLSLSRDAGHLGFNVVSLNVKSLTINSNF